MRPFSLEEYLKNPSRKIVTRDGRNARIVCTDKKGFNPILALVTKHDSIAEDIYLYTKNGELNEGNSTKSSLFFVPEKHERWVNLYKEDDNIYASMDTFKTKEEAEALSCSSCIATVKVEWEE